MGSVSCDKPSILYHLDLTMPSSNEQCKIFKLMRSSDLHKLLSQNLYVTEGRCNALGYSGNTAELTLFDLNSFLFLCLFT